MLRLIQTLRPVTFTRSSRFVSTSLLGSLTRNYSASVTDPIRETIDSLSKPTFTTAKPAQYTAPTSPPTPPPTPKTTPSTATQDQTPIAFQTLPIHSNTTRAMIEGFKYSKTTGVQTLISQHIPITNDLLVKAKTGTGKTIGFLIPAIETVLRDGPLYVDFCCLLFVLLFVAV